MPLQQTLTHVDGNMQMLSIANLLLPHIVNETAEIMMKFILLSLMKTEKLLEQIIQFWKHILDQLPQEPKVKTVKVFTTKI